MVYDLRCAVHCTSAVLTLDCYWWSQFLAFEASVEHITNETVFFFPISTHTSECIRWNFHILNLPGVQNKQISNNRVKGKKENIIGSHPVWHIRYYSDTFHSCPFGARFCKCDEELEKQTNKPFWYVHRTKHSLRIQSTVSICIVSNPKM